MFRLVSALAGTGAVAIVILLGTTTPGVADFSPTPPPLATGSADPAPGMWGNTNQQTTTCATGFIAYEEGRFTGTVSSCWHVGPTTKIGIIFYGDGTDAAAHPWFSYAPNAAPTHYYTGTMAPMVFPVHVPVCVANAPYQRIACITVHFTDQGVSSTPLAINDPGVKFRSVVVVADDDPNCATCV